jgi:4-alpha-glucanotransferase
MKRLNVALALHNHQPVGNFGWVLEDNYRNAYLPMLESLEAHPGVRVALHYSGFLLDWLCERHPDFVERVRALVARGQAEMMGGGYYEPILPSIPDRDKRSQLLRMADAVERRFGRRPTGLWLAERVWEAALAKPLAEAGYQYTILDDSHFERAGMKTEELYTPFVTEEQGHSLKLLATGTRMRYLIPWTSVEECLGYFRETAAKEPRLVLMGDDGEKFGGWPTTARLCWEEGWVDRFFTALEAESSWLRTVLPGEYARTELARGPVYLPAGSYPEMLRWSGGFWRNFLGRYPEANAMHKKMLRVSRRVAEAGSPERAVNELLRGQANDAYWHGVFGGVYLPHLRRAAWQGLLAAERAVTPAGAPASSEVADYDADGACELLLESSTQNAYVAPALGGAVVEWDVHGRNAVDVIARRSEPYHDRLRLGDKGERVSVLEEPLRVREPGLEKRLHYDRRRRLVFQAYLVRGDATLRQAVRGALHELGGFAAGEFTLGRGGVMEREEGVGRVRVRMRRSVHLASGGHGLELRLALTVSGAPLDALLVVESNLGLVTSVHEGSVGGQPLDEPVDLGERSQVALGQPDAGLEYRLSAPAGGRFWHYPVETVNNSENGYERITQGACLLALRPVRLAEGDGLKLRWRLQALS